TLIMVAPPIPPQVVNTQPDGGAVEPAAGVLTVGFRRPPKFPERLDRDILGASGVADDASHYARNSRVLRVEARVEIPLVAFGIHPVEEFGTSVHHTSNTGRARIVTGKPTACSPNRGPHLLRAAARRPR